MVKATNEADRFDVVFSEKRLIALVTIYITNEKNVTDSK